MVITNWGKRQIGLLIAGSHSNYPAFFIIGSGSGAILTTDTSLIYATDRQAVTSTDNSTLYKIKWTGDWNSAEMSGTSFKEWGTCISGVTTTGSIWSRTGLPAITFNGTNELRIEETWEVY